MQLQNVLYFLAWAVFFFLMMRFGCGAHVMGHHHHHTESDSADRGSWTPPGQARDPVCGMTVQTAQAKSTVLAGHVYYFCSQDCRNTFEADPARYAQARGSAKSRQEHTHGH